IFLALTAALLVVTGALVVGPAAVALRALEHAYGFVATTPDHSWLGSHRLDDGNLGFCLNVSKHPPEGNHFLYQRGDS
ncbi:hypothetical protein QN367_19765, partial [Cryobacterium sp. RTS3]|nr:hypothetical protein [Cryobacterium sp. RTS3]